MHHACCRVSRPGAVNFNALPLTCRSTAAVPYCMCICWVSGAYTDLVHFAKKVNTINSTIFVLFDKYCLIMDQLGSKDSSRDFQLNCVISYFFTYI